MEDKFTSNTLCRRPVHYNRNVYTYSFYNYRTRVRTMAHVSCMPQASTNLTHVYLPIYEIFLYIYTHTYIHIYIIFECKSIV